MIDVQNPQVLTGQTQSLGLLVCRGPALTIIAPADGSEEVENPFAQTEEEGGAVI